MRDIIGSFQERMGLNAYVSGDYEGAERWFRKLESREGESLRVLRNLGVILLARGDAEGAGRYLRREEERFGPSYHRHCALGDLAYAGGRREEALRRYRAALAEPDGGGAGASRALLEVRAAACADAAAYARTRGAQERFAAGEAARDAGRHEEALAAFEEAAALDPSMWPALNNAGAVLLNGLGDAARAAPYFEKAFALSGSAQSARNAELARQAAARQGLGRAERTKRKDR